MPSEQEIKANYKAQHDTLAASYYGGTSGLTKEQFDIQHGQIWGNMKAELIANGYLTPLIPKPPYSGHPAQLIAINAGAARPASVKRLWGGKEYLYDCLATQTIVDEYLAGKIIIGDYLWVEFLDPSEDIGGGEQIVIGKVKKTW